jgi:hypothetical protein
MPWPSSIEDIMAECNNTSLMCRMPTLMNGTLERDIIIPGRHYILKWTDIHKSFLVRSLHEVHLN